MTSLLAANDTHWCRALSRWAFGTGLALLGVLISFGIIMMTQAGGDLPPEYDELVGAIQQPGLYRVATALDIATRIGISGLLALLAAVFARRSPTRALLLAGCGVGQLAGAVGAWTRLVGVSALATQYAAAAPGEQPGILRSFLDLQLVIGADFGAGSLFWSIGLLLAASVAWRERLFPRWLAGLLALTGACNLAGDIVGMLGMSVPFELFITPLVLLAASLFGVAAACRGQKAMPPAVAETGSQRYQERAL